jgi:hypothetical protein
MEFILSHLDLSSYSNDEELLEEIAIDDQIVVQPAIICVNIGEYFTSAKLDEKNGQSVNPDVGVWDILVTSHTTFVLSLSPTSLWENLKNWCNLWSHPLLVLQGPQGSHIAPLGDHPIWPWNNICLVSSCS